jgi:hypothetical protein
MMISEPDVYALLSVHLRSFDGYEEASLQR